MDLNTGKSELFTLRRFVERSDIRIRTRITLAFKRRLEELLGHPWSAEKMERSLSKAIALKEATSIKQFVVFSGSTFQVLPYDDHVRTHRIREIGSVVFVEESVSDSS